MERNLTTTKMMQRVFGLTNQINALEAGLETAKTMLECVKRIKDAEEPNPLIDADDCEVESQLVDAVNQPPEVSVLKSKERLLRAEFTNIMVELTKEASSLGNGKQIRDQKKLMQEHKEESYKLTKALEQKNKHIIAQEEINKKDKKSWLKLKDEIDPLPEENRDLTKKLEEETLPKTLIENSPLQRFIDSLPKCLKPILAPKGSVTGDELGTFMGSLVINTAYNVAYSNKDLNEVIILNSVGNMFGSIVGQICNNFVTYISQTNSIIRRKPAISPTSNSGLIFSIGEHKKTQDVNFYHW